MKYQPLANVLEADSGNDENIGTMTTHSSLGAGPSTLDECSTFIRGTKRCRKPAGSHWPGMLGGHFAWPFFAVPLALCMVLVGGHSIAEDVPLSQSLSDTIEQITAYYSEHEVHGFDLVIQTRVWHDIDPCEDWLDALRIDQGETDKVQWHRIVMLNDAQGLRGGFADGAEPAEALEIFVHDDATYDFRAVWDYPESEAGGELVVEPGGNGTLESHDATTYLRIASFGFFPLTLAEVIRRDCPDDCDPQLVDGLIRLRLKSMRPDAMQPRDYFFNASTLEIERAEYWLPFGEQGQVMWSGIETMAWSADERSGLRFPSKTRLLHMPRHDGATWALIETTVEHLALNGDVDPSVLELPEIPVGTRVVDRVNDKEYIAE